MSYALECRLMNAKTKAAENATKREGTPSFYSPGFLDSYYPVDWRVIARAAARRRYQKPGIWNPPSIDDRGRAWRWLESVNGSGLIVVCENATKRANRDTTGYYTRSDGGDPIHGVVLATRNEESPKARFFAAISDYDNPGAYRILWEAEDSLDDAIRTADHIAGESAEEARDYDAAHTAGRAWADFGEGIKTLRKEALAILKDRKAAHGSPILCAVIREKVESLVSEIADMRKRRARLADGQGASDSDHWSQFYTGDKRLRAAFNDGAESPVLTV